MEYTPAEMELMQAGQRERTQNERRFQAQMVANLMNCHGPKQAITAQMLLGIAKKPKRKTKEQLIKEAQKRQRTYADYQREHGE